MKSLFSSTIDLIYPKYCVVCGMPGYGHEDFLCLKCELDLPLGYFKLGTQNPIEKTFWGRCNIGYGGSYMRYDRNSDYAKIMHRIKYDGAVNLAQIMGQRYGHWLHKNCNQVSEIEALIPVPIHPKKLKRRGYNQAEEIALGMSEILKIPVTNQVLNKVSDTQSQTKRNRFSRWENIKEQYQIGNLNDTIKHLAIVDDVITTGATIESCIREIHKYYNVKVSVLSLGFTQ